MENTKMSRDKKIRLLCFIIILALCLAMIPIMSFAGGEDEYVGQDVTGLVALSNLKLVYDKKVELTSENASEVAFVVGKSIDATIDWSVSEGNLSKIKTKDYFQVALPTQIKFNQVKEGSKVRVPKNTELPLIGYYTVIQNPDTKQYFMTFTFEGDLTEFNNISDGFLSLSGTVADYEGEGNELEFNNISIPKVVIQQKPTTTPSATKFNWGSFTRNDEFYKTGANVSGDIGLVYWRIYAGYDVYQTLLANPTAQVATKNNTFIYDELPQGVTFEGKITETSVPLYMIDDEGNMAGQTVRTCYLKLNYVEQNSGESFDDFKARIKDGGAGSYGYYENPTTKIQTLIFYVGNYPGDMKVHYSGTPYTWQRFNTRLDTKITELAKTTTDSAMLAEAKTNTINRWKQIYARSTADGNVASVTSDTALSVLGFNFRFNTRVSSEAKLTGTNQISNTAIMSWQDSNPIQSSKQFTVNSLDAGAKSIAKTSIKLTKLDQTSKEPLKGVSFELQRLKEDGSVHSTIPAQTTNELGVVQFDKLAYATYKIVETGGLKGYKQPLSVYNGDFKLDNNTFTLTSDLEEGYQFTGYNYRILGTVDVTKYDATDKGVENKTKTLEGVEFQLLYWDESLGAWTNYKDENASGEMEIVKKVTGKDGKVQFTNLPWGKYKLVETVGAENYDPQLILDDGVIDEFVIGNNEDSGEVLKINYNAYNEQEKKEEETTTPGVVKGDDTPPTDAQGQVLPDIVNPEDGDVLGEEAKTGDVSNLMPILILIAFSMIIMLIATLQAYRKED